MKIMEDYWGEGNVPHEVLLDIVKNQGSTVFDAERFLSEEREFSGKILK